MPSPKPHSAWGLLNRGTSWGWMLRVLGLPKAMCVCDNAVVPDSISLGIVLEFSQRGLKPPQKVEEDSMGGTYQASLRLPLTCMYLI